MPGPILKHFFYLVIIFFSIDSIAQDAFRLIRGEDRHSVRFKLINNLIIIPVEVNGSELNFLLDTGVDNTIMFSLTQEDSLRLKDVQKIRIRGLGEGEYFDALKSSGNFFKIGNVVNGNHMVYVILGDEFNLSSSMGIPINGIIGGDLFRNFVVDINYDSKRIRFYDTDKYELKKCKKCQFFDLDFDKNKPYITIEVQPINCDKMDVKLLIDLGGSDALWLFEKSHEDITLPERYFEDYLGKGLSGNIYGKRSKVSKIFIGDYVFTNANVAYPDSSSIEHAYKIKERNGSLGSEILKRFRLVFDYPHKRLILKNKSTHFNDPFLHNMSGIELAHNGSMVVAERQRSLFDTNTDQNDLSTVEILYGYVYALKPSYRIAALRKNSPAANAGLKEGDIILKINNKPAYNYKYEEIIHIFSTKEGRQMKLLIERNGEELTYAFTLEKMI